MKKTFVLFLCLCLLLCGCRALPVTTASTGTTSKTATQTDNRSEKTTTTSESTSTSSQTTESKTESTTYSSQTKTDPVQTTEKTASTSATASKTETSRPAQSGTGIYYQGTGPVVVIDPGHQLKGNSDKEPNAPGSDVMKTKVMSGTYGRFTGLTEYELNLRVALALRDELIKRGYTVVMIRETNEVDISNAERSQIANDYEADAFIRIHANGSDNASVNGCETICQSRSNPYNGDLYDESRRLSQCVLDAFCKSTGIKKRSVVESDTMTGINWCRTPVTIIEMGFMTNQTDDEFMASQSFPAIAAKGIADGIDAFFE